MCANAIDLRLIAMRQMEIQLEMQRDLAALAVVVQQLVEQLGADDDEEDSMSEYTLNGSSSSSSEEEEEEEEEEAPASAPEAEDEPMDIAVASTLPCSNLQQ
jgi:hypothetical protein